MTFRAIPVVLFVVLMAFPCSAAEGGPDSFIVLSYHDVRDDVVDDLDKDRMAAGTLNLINQFSWLREHGYHPVSMDEIIAARDGRRHLPPRAVLLTFDDGYKNVYTKVFPILKMFGYPAVVAVVVKWMEAGEDELIQYGKEKVKRSRFFTWEEAREMAKSGLVEIASHSYDLHHGVPGNPQGNIQPAGVTFIYDERSKTYESVSRFRERVGGDIRKSAAIIEKRLGKRPRVMVWPYGMFNSIGAREAAGAGMSVNFSLDECVNSVDDLRNVCRILVDKNPDLEDFIWTLRNYHKRLDPVRVAHVDIDYLFDEDKARQKKNLDVLLDRIKEMEINTVYLQAYADPDGDGVADALYFPSRHMKTREDLFNRVAWQLRTRAGVEVYAWMPVMAFDLGDEKLMDELVVREWYNGEAARSSGWYKRLSPFNPRARKIIGEIYEDLAIHASFDGILFHDDAYLGDFEDAGKDAVDVYKKWGFDGDIGDIRSDERLFLRWTRLKTEALAGFTDELAARVKEYRPRIRTARNMYASSALESDGETWLAQSLDIFLRHYDYTALMAMPYMEGARSPDRWLRRLVEKVSGNHPGGLKKAVFELQSVNWATGENIPTATLTRQMKALQRMGAVNFGYYPDDFITDHPELSVIKQGISLGSYPYRKR